MLLHLYNLSPLHWYSLTFPQPVSLKLLHFSHYGLHTYHPFCLLPHGAAQSSTEHLLRLFFFLIFLLHTVYNSKAEQKSLKLMEAFVE